MVSSLYWVSALVFAFVLFSILLGDNREKKTYNSFDKSFRKLLKWVIYFCMQDAVWGLCGSQIIPGDSTFFVSSAVFHSSTVLTTFVWLIFILNYLDNEVKHKRAYITLDILAIIFQFSLVLINFFYPIVFSVENGIYYTYSFRGIAFLNQYIVYILCGIITLIYAQKSEKEKRSKYITAFWFSAAPIATGLFQFLYPDAPFYSMGYFLGCMIIYIFAVNGERVRSIHIIEEHQRITTSLSEIYFFVCLVNLEKLEAKLINAPVHAKEILGDTTSPGNIFSRINKDLINEEDIDVMWKFNDFTRWREVLSQTDTVSMEFKATAEGWSRANIVVSKRDNNGEVKEVIYAVQQISDQKKREEDILKNLRDALSLADKSNKAKSTFLSNMSHDIRTPMNAVVNYTKLALAEPDLSEKTKTYLDGISQAGDHLMSLINSVLDMSRIESGKISLDESSSNISELLDELSALIHSNIEEKHQRFTVNKIDVVHENIMCDELRFKQIMINLLSNATKYTDKGGRISLTVKEESILDSKESMYHFIVKDNGIGIEEGFLDQLFEPFERESTSTISGIQGTGLGLAITKNLVEMMGGTIGVKSKKGEGTEFSVDIPFFYSEDIAKEQADENTQASEYIDYSNRVKTARILLVEDNKVNRIIAKSLLEDKVLILDEAVNGQEAISILKSKDPNYYNLILMDIQMPIMNGYEATKAIRNSGNYELSVIPIIAMTANAFEEDKREAIKAGMNDHISKPVEQDVLIETIGKCLADRK